MSKYVEFLLVLKDQNIVVRTKNLLFIFRHVFMLLIESVGIVMSLRASVSNIPTSMKFFFGQTAASKYEGFPTLRVLIPFSTSECAGVLVESQANSED